MYETVIIIDDDKKFNQIVSDYLIRNNYIVQSFTNPVEGLHMIHNEEPDIVLLDLMLPKIDGFEVCKEIRKTSTVPIIFLSARQDVMDRITGLEVGADDYLPKPIELRELTARIQAILRREKKSFNKNKIQFGNMLIDYELRSVSINQKEIKITSSEFEILSILSQNQGRVLSRNMLAEKLKGFDRTAFDRSIDVLIGRLRKKIHDDPNHPGFIKTIWGVGYLFIPTNDRFN
jgi:DNA-binding response OmpR family regulator